jgi:hypothetical protein
MARRRPTGIIRSRSAPGYGYTAFEGEEWFALACWLYKRAWAATGERPIVLFDLAIRRLRRSPGEPRQAEPAR